MAYLVEVTLGAQRDLIDIYERISADDSVVAARWFNGLEAAIDTLELFPRRCPMAPENTTGQRRLRHLLYGSKRDVYRVIYDIDEPRKLVRVRAIRHTATDEFVGGR
jgi:toxin ParE1/3/4